MSVDFKKSRREFEFGLRPKDQPLRHVRKPASGSFVLARRVFHLAAAFSNEVQTLIQKISRRIYFRAKASSVNAALNLPLRAWVVIRSKAIQETVAM